MDLMMSNPDPGVAVVGKMDLSNRANSTVAWKTVWSILFTSDRRIVQKLNLHSILLRRLYFHNISFLSYKKAFWLEELDSSPDSRAHIQRPCGAEFSF